VLLGWWVQQVRSRGFERTGLKERPMSDPEPVQYECQVGLSIVRMVQAAVKEADSLRGLG
jgi:hypothetical protein